MEVEKMQFITVEQLADIFQVKNETVRKWVKESRVPYFKAGGTIRFDLEQVLECFAKGEVKE